MIPIFANIDTQAQSWEFDKENEMYADSPAISFSYPSGKYFSVGYNLDTESWFIMYAKDEDDLRGTFTHANSLDDALKKLKSEYGEYPDERSIHLLRQETAKYS